MKKYYFETYKNLSANEVVAIGYYCIGDERLMDNHLIERDFQLSKDMRRFLADVLARRMKLKPKKMEDRVI